MFSFLRRKSDIAVLERTLKLLAGYHAVTLDNEQFVRQYRHLIAMYSSLCKRSGKPSLFEEFFYVR